LEWAKPIWPRPSQPNPQSLSARDETREAFSPVGTGDLPAKSGWPVDGGGVVGEQASGVIDRFVGRREGRAHRSGGFHGGANRAVGSNGGGVVE
jgi:hypothetical protein